MCTIGGGGGGGLEEVNEGKGDIYGILSTIKIF